MLYRKIIFFGIVFSVFAFQNVEKVFAATDVKECRCYKLIEDTQYTPSKPTATSDDCNQSCANMGGFTAFSFNYTANQTITKTPGDAVNVAEHTCSCSSTAPYSNAITGTFAVANDSECISLCQSSNSKVYQFDKNAWKDVPAKTAAVTAPVNPQAISNIVGGAGAKPSDDSNKGLVKCGNTGQPFCRMCDIIIGMNVIIKYAMGIAVFVALAAITIGGVMYIVSAGDQGMTTNAKEVMKNAGIGIVIIFAAWLIVNYTMVLIGTNDKFGITQTGWNNFQCK